MQGELKEDRREAKRNLAFQLRREEGSHGARNFPSFLYEVAYFSSERVGEVATVLFYILLTYVGTRTRHGMGLGILRGKARRPIVTTAIICTSGRTLRGLRKDIAGISKLTRLGVPSGGACCCGVSCINFIPTAKGVRTARARGAICLRRSRLKLGRMIIANSHATQPVGVSPIAARILNNGRLIRTKCDGLRRTLRRRAPNLGVRGINFKGRVSVRKLSTHRILFLVSNRHVANSVTKGLSCRHFGLRTVSHVRVMGKTDDALCNSHTTNTMVGLVAGGAAGPLSVSTNIHCKRVGRHGCGGPRPGSFLCVFRGGTSHPGLRN